MILTKFVSTAAPTVGPNPFQLKRDFRLPEYDPRESAIGTIRTHRQTGTVILLESGQLLTTTHLICDLERAQDPEVSLKDCYDPIDSIRLEFVTQNNQLLVVGVKAIPFDGLKIIAHDGFSSTGWDIALLETSQDLRPILGPGLRIVGEPDDAHDATFISRPDIGVHNDYTRMITQQKGTSLPTAAESGTSQYQTFQADGFSVNIPSFSGGVELQGNQAISFKYQNGLQFHGWTIADKINWFEKGVYRAEIDRIDRGALTPFLAHHPFTGQPKKNPPYYDALMTEATARVRYEITRAIRLARECANKDEKIQARLKTSKEQLKHSRHLLKTWLSYNPTSALTSTDPEKVEKYLHSISKDLISGATFCFEKEAVAQFEKAASSIKEPILGNRQDVATQKKDHLILDVGIWSWGVNQAFIEGIASKGTTVRLHTPFSGTANDFLATISLSKPKMNQKTFLKHIEEKEKEDEALWHGLQNRHTWYAIEIAALLDLGYRLEKDEMILNKAPNITNSPISKETSEIGINAYLKMEGLILNL